MATIVFIMIILAGYHYYMENVVIPIHRQELDLEFNRLGERLRFLHKQHGKDIHDDIIIDLGRALINAPKILDQLSLSRFSLNIIMRSKNKNEVGSRKTSEFYEAIEHCEVKEVKEIMNEHFVLLKRAFIINSLAWVIYLTPFVLLLAVLKHIASVKQRLIRFYRKQIITVITTGGISKDVTLTVLKGKKLESGVRPLHFHL